MALPREITMPVIRPERPPSDIESLVDRGKVVKTNRTNQGIWGSYLDALRKAPGSSPEAHYERPGESNPRVSGPKRNPLAPKPVKPRGRSTGKTRSGASAAIGGRVTPKLGASPAGPRPSIGANYGAGQPTPPGQDTSSYLAGLRHYGSGMRSAPNVGPVSNKAGYNERDRKNARVSGASLATGDEQARVRLLGG